MKKPFLENQKATDAKTIVERRWNVIMKHIINRADIIGGLKSVKLAKKFPQYYQPGVGVSEDFELLYNYKNSYYEN